MRRVGGLFERIVDPENLRLAFWKASRGKAARKDQQSYRANLGEELARLHVGLIDESYEVGDYRRFVIHEPKHREICAAAFRERVLHHALMNVCEPYIDRWLIDQTYACRRGFGQWKAILRAQTHARRRGWYLKCDFRKFFDSISHDGVLQMLERRFKDKFVIRWFGRIVDTYQTKSGFGLPIGNLTSQHLANLYLDRLDRFVAEGHATTTKGKSVDYVRYMDDFVYWSDDKGLLRNLRDEICQWSADVLGLTVKAEPPINRTCHGMEFLGHRVYPRGVRLSRQAWRRFQRKAAGYEWLFAVGAISEATLQERVTALTGCVVCGATVGLRKAAIREEFGGRQEAQGQNRALRGGSYNNDAGNCRSGKRNGNDPSNDNNDNGFRLCCSAAPQEQLAVPVGLQFPHLVRDKYVGNPALVGTAAEDDGLPPLMSMQWK